MGAESKSGADDESAPISRIESESIGETLPGDKIRRGSIRPTNPNPRPDLALCGELGTELPAGFATASALPPRTALHWRRTETLSGLAGGTANEQHHDLRRPKPGFRRDESSMAGKKWTLVRRSSED